MELFHSVMLGFGVAFQPVNLFFCFFGVLIGTLVGVLPGLGPTAAISLLLPTTFHVSPVSAIIMLAGIYYGAMYGGSTTSILVNIPGEAASVVTTLDGYQMARKGMAGPALGIAAFGSFIAGTFSIVCLMLIAPPLSAVALEFGPPEYFTLMILGLTILTFLASGPMWKALLMAAFGLFLGSMGLDIITGSTRFTFGVMELLIRANYSLHIFFFMISSEHEHQGCTVSSADCSGRSSEKGAPSDCQRHDPGRNGTAFWGQPPGGQQMAQEIPGRRKKSPSGRTPGETQAGVVGALAGGSNCAGDRGSLSGPNEASFFLVDARGRWGLDCPAVWDWPFGVDGREVFGPMGFHAAKAGASSV